MERVSTEKGAKYMNQPSLQTSAEVWDFLLSRGGLDLKYYDSAILDEMREKLNIPLSKGKRDFKQELEGYQIDVEHLIIAFFQATAPFSCMMSDLLMQFEKAGAFRTTNNLKVKFDFDTKATALEFDLEHFRSWQIQFIHASRPVHVYEVNPDILFSLYYDLRVFLDVNGIQWNPQHQEVKRWVEDYDGESLPKGFPAFHLIGYAAFDQAFGSLYEVWQQVWADYLFYDIARTTVNVNDEAVDQYRWCLRRLESDRWFRQFLLLLEVLYSRYLDEQNEAWFLDTSRFIMGLLDQIPKTLRNKSVLTQELESFLELPIWQRRYDLYAAWISTQMMMAMNDSTMKYIHENGTITFSFARNHLATSRKYEPTLELWSEVRTPLDHPKGKSRKKNIQPDYSLLTEIADAERSTLLVVECKQYRRAASQSFADALNDYAQGRSNARVVIVNYGKGNSNIASKVDQNVRSRVKVIHEMRPNSVKAIQEFQDYIKNVIAQACSERVPEASAPTTAMKAHTVVTSALLPLRVTLTWGKQPRDLDLHLSIVTPGGTTSPVIVNYRSKGSHSAFPWSTLDKDEQGGFGPEEIQVYQWLPGVYLFTVNNFSITPSLAQSEAKVTISLNGQPPIEISCPIAGDGESWEVFSYDSTTSQLRINNRLQTKR